MRGLYNTRLIRAGTIRLGRTVTEMQSEEIYSEGLYREGTIQ